jgi:phage-related protein
LVDGILELLPELIPVAIQAIVVLAQGLIDALPKLIEKLPEIIQTIVDVLVDNLPLLITAAYEIIIALAVALIKNLPLLYEAELKIMTSIVEGIIRYLGKLPEVAINIFNKLKEAFTDINWAELGKNIIDGITQGVINAAKKLAKSVADAARNALNAAKSVLGINSPSTVMRDQVGMMIGAGMAEGIEDSTKQVNAAMNGLSRRLIAQGSVNMTTGVDLMSRKSGTQSIVSAQGIDYKRIEAAIYVGMSEAIKDMPTPKADVSMDGKKMGQIIFPRLIEELDRLGLDSI